MGRKLGILLKASIILLIPVLIFSVFYPVVMAGGVTGGTGSSLSTPESCLTSETHSTEGEADIVATAALEANGDVNITYEPTSDTRPLKERPFSLLSLQSMEFIDTHGFITGDENREYILNRSADSHWIRYRMTSGNSTDLDTARYPSTDEWAITVRPPHSKGKNVSLKTAGDGYTGSKTMYLGDFDRHSRTVGCQEFQVIVPNEVHSEFDADSRLDDLEAAARRIPSDQKNETVTVFVSPSSQGIGSRVGGFVLSGTSDIIVQEDGHFVNPGVVWIHEYIHTLQATDLQSDLQWVNEGLPTYLGYEIAVESGRITPIERDMYLGLSVSGGENMSLMNTTNQASEYMKGAAVFAQIDSDLRKKTDKSAYDMQGWFNSQNQTSYSDFERYLRDDAGLSNATVESYEPVIAGETAPTIDYRHAPANIPLPGLLLANWLLSPDIRLASMLILGAISIYGVLKYSIKKVRLSPENITF